MDRPTRIHHLALRVADPARALAFYGGVLGLPEARRFDEGGRVRSIWVRIGDAVLMLEREIKGRQATGANEGSAHVLVLAVADLAIWEDRLAAAGVTIADRTPSTLYILDPDGHCVGLSVFDFGR
jgi:catechol 2,3-dioxygenase-like lactoylglutathione lyase family enzyme